MKLGSLFDGSGGFPLAGSLCGIEPVWAAEVEPYPIAVTHSRFPSMRHLGDISKVDGSKLEPVDIITFGSPCQDLSVAGKQAGIKHTDAGDDETTRSGLFVEAVRIIKEMREATHGLYPRFALWENVPGAFSSNSGEDFRTVLEELIRIPLPGAVMPPVPRGGWAYADSYTGDGWSLAYRVFDAQYWGVPQRRRRIHLVLDLRGECAREVLFEREGLRGYFAPGGAQGQGTAPDAEAGAHAADQTGDGSVSNRVLDNQQLGAGGIIEHRGLDAVTFEPGIAAREGGHIYDGVCGTPRANAGDNRMAVAFTQNQRNEVRDLGDLAGSLQAQPGMKQQTFVCQPACTISAKQQSLAVGEELAASLGANDYKEPQVVFCPVVDAPLGTGGNNTPFVVASIDGDKIGKAERAGGSGLGIRDGDKMYTLTAKDAGTHSVCYGIGNGQANQSFSEELVGALNCMHDQQAVAYADLIVLDKEVYQSGINATGGHYIAEGGPAPTLRTTGHPPGVSYGVDCRNATETPELNGTLRAKPNGGFSMNCNQIVRTQYIVRRLTPTECARLQGFVDNWGIPDHKDSFTDAEWCFWSNVRNTHAAINGRAVKSYTKAQMLAWYNKLHTDSAEYKMWGNGIALPPALYCMQGMTDVLTRAEDDSWLL